MRYWHLEADWDVSGVLTDLGFGLFAKEGRYRWYVAANVCRATLLAIKGVRDVAKCERPQGVLFARKAVLRE